MILVYVILLLSLSMNRPNVLEDSFHSEEKGKYVRICGPTRRSRQWTIEEDEVLSKAVEHFEGKNWKKIAECLKNRTAVQCLHRWQKVLNPELVKGSWSKQEDNTIMAMVEKHGPKKWSIISQHLPGRIGKQCRERWHNHLNPAINKNAWTPEEELILVRAHQIYGNKWAEIMKFLPGRSDNSIKNHWNSSVKKNLDSYNASGLLDQYQSLPLIAFPNQSIVSSSSWMQSSGDEGSSSLRLGADAEESQCSQASTVFSCSQSLNDLSKEVKSANEEFYIPGLPSVTEQQISESASHANHDFVLDLLTHNLDVDGKNEEVQVFQSSVRLSDQSSLPNLDTGWNVVDHQKGKGSLCSQSAETHTHAHESGNISALSWHPSSSGGLKDPVFLCTDSNDPIQGRQLLGATALERKTDTNGGFIDTDGHVTSHGNEDKGSVLEQQELPYIPNLVPLNSFYSPPRVNKICFPIDDKPDEKDKGCLCCEPPRFPIVDSPFFSCDLLSSDTEVKQEYSPFGIRQLMISPLRLWDSHLLDRRKEKKLKTASASSLAKDFSHLDVVILDEGDDCLSSPSKAKVSRDSALARLDLEMNSTYEEPKEVSESRVTSMENEKGCTDGGASTETDQETSGSLIELRLCSPDKTRSRPSSAETSFNIEDFSIFDGTPFTKLLDSPSPWKSPSLSGSFLPSLKLAPEATTYTNALKVLGNDTPESILKKRQLNKKSIQGKENQHQLHDQLVNQSQVSA